MKLKRARTCATCKFSNWCVATGDYCQYHKENIPTDRILDNFLKSVCDNHKFGEKND